jgi:hypothetical protein
MEMFFSRSRLLDILLQCSNKVKYLSIYPLYAFCGDEMVIISLSSLPAYKELLSLRIFSRIEHRSPMAEHVDSHHEVYVDVQNNVPAAVPVKAVLVAPPSSGHFDDDGHYHAADMHPNVPTPKAYTPPSYSPSRLSPAASRSPSPGHH